MTSNLVSDISVIGSTFVASEDTSVSRASRITPVTASARASENPAAVTLRVMARVTKAAVAVGE